MDTLDTLSRKRWEGENKLSKAGKIPSCVFWPSPTFPQAHLLMRETKTDRVIIIICNKKSPRTFRNTLYYTNNFIKTKTQGSSPDESGKFDTTSPVWTQFFPSGAFLLFRKLTVKTSIFFLLIERNTSAFNHIQHFKTGYRKERKYSL